MNEWIEITSNNRYIIHLDGLFKLLLRNFAVILFFTLLFGGGAYAYSSYCITPLYQSSIKMYVNNTADSSDTTSITSSDIAASQYLVDTYAVVLTSYPTLSAVIEQTGIDYTYEQLSRMISTTAINETEVFQVTVTCTDPTEAAQIANAIADIAPDEIMEIVSGSSVKIVEYARVATSQSSPNVGSNAVKGAMAGFLLSCIGVVLISLLKSGMSVEDKICHDFKDEAILSVIPQMGDSSTNKKKKKKQRGEAGAELCENLSFASAESYRLLRENITYYFSDEQSCRVIGVTSSVRDEGKTTISINLAYTLALSNKRVCLIDGDFRLPSVAKKLGLHRKPGMTNALIGQLDGENIFQRYDSDQATLYVVTAGSVPPNPSELLGSSRMKDMMKLIESSFDYLILDLPPVGIVSDALAIKELINGMLFVVREDFYDRKLVQESLHTLEAVDTKILGMVVTRSTTQQKEYKRYSGKYGYKYGYGYEDSQKDQEEESASSRKEDRRR